MKKNVPITSERKKEVMDGLLAAVLKESTNIEGMKNEAEIRWMKAGDGTKKSIVILSFNSRNKRNEFLTSVNNNTSYRLRKTVPSRYCTALKDLDRVAYILRKMHPRLITTDYAFEGVKLNLIFRTRKCIDDKY